MNHFQNLAKLVRKRKEKINSFYAILETNESNETIDKMLELVSLEKEKNTVLAMLRYLVDLKEENIVKELEKKYNNEEISALKHLLYEQVCKFYEKENQELIEIIKKNKLLNSFYQVLVQGVHNIGKVMNALESVWTKELIEKNNKILSEQFENLDSALEFLRENRLYQTDHQGGICERAYGVLLRDPLEFENVKKVKWRGFVTYAQYFKDEILQLKSAFDMMLNELKIYAQDENEILYVDYFNKLKIAFCEENIQEVVKKWQEAELAWMKVKSPIQIGHPLEYYEDNYTHAVAMEWDMRLEEQSCFNAEGFKQNIKESFIKVYENIGINDINLKNEVEFNLDKTQLYICTPMMFYGAELKGLFSAQVVPNDEFVSRRAGKKIFAFLNFVYESAKAKPFMKLPNLIFEKEFLDYGREILFFKEELWKKIYEISTIGHEFGHIFFISADTEKIMNQSGVFKNIEEYKATAGGLINFFYHEEQELKMPVFYELIKRSIGLIIWQKVDEFKPYYTEGLIHLSLLFESGVCSFKNSKLKINFTLEFYEKFKELTFKTYHNLAKHYALKIDASEFLRQFCFIENGIYLPNLQECKDFVEFYYALYEKFGNVLDDSGEFEKYRTKIA